VFNIFIPMQYFSDQDVMFYIGKKHDM